MVEMRFHSGHYAAAFEEYLRGRGVPCVSIDESRRSLMAGARIKSFDYLVYPPEGPHLIVDLKGRKFPYRAGGSNRYWENWVGRADIEGLCEWERAFGEGYRAVFVFAYWLGGEPGRWPKDPVHLIDGRYYAFYVVPVAEYAAQARMRSPRWGTLSLRGSSFRQLARPLIGVDGDGAPGPGAADGLYPTTAANL